ncbi:hypothetical protein [Terrabacter sp. NPDC080008]|uniref:hypothetical protein n=1 Tax=Terrabacter sp. NPDC080008 TaxID=3155176 RepID=UPI00344C1752
MTAAALSAAASWALLRGSSRLPAAARAPWERVNHAGRAVTLLEGPAWVGGALLGAAAAAAVARATTGTPAGTPAGATTGATPDAIAGATADVTAGLSFAPAGRRAGLRLLTTARPSRTGPAAATRLLAMGAGALGAVDDLVGGTTDKGLKGHLGALARGEVTTGAVKIVGLGVCGLLAVATSDVARARAGHDDATRPAGIRVLSTLLGGAVVAGAANAVNLFDLRPGRALKVAIGWGLPLSGTTAGAAALGASLGVLREDLQATSMLGDTGANAAGALLGLALTERTGPAGRAVALAALTALTLASERVSFTRVIEASPVLRRVDEWGREAP